MAKLPIRMITIGLGTLSMSGCLIIPPDMHDAGPNAPLTSSPTATPAPTSATVRRVAPPPMAMSPQPANPNTPVQFIAIPADQLVYDATGRPMAKADAIPPGYMPVVLPPNTQVNTAMAAAPPQVMAGPELGNEAVEVVAISHTIEPPLATVDPPKKVMTMPSVPKPLPEVVNKTTALPEVTNKSEPLPAIVNNRPMQKPAMPMTPPVRPVESAANGQLLVLQPPTSYNPIQNTAKENLFIPPVAPEELKLVSAVKSSCCAGPLTAALKAYQDRMPEDADRQLSQLDAGSRDLLRKMLPVAAKLGEPGNATANPAEIAELVDELQQMAGTLRSMAALRIEKLSYCRTPGRAVRMGAYQPLADDHAFRTGETVELYMELRNFSCQPKEKEFHTHLKTAIEVRDERNEVVARFDFERDKPDVGQAPRTDYFHICRFPLQGLGTGSYTLCATVTDVPTGKSATKTLPLRVEGTRSARR